jgi:ABC-type transport system involved in multi-copper enzyme maturation permease subunit
LSTWASKLSRSVSQLADLQGLAGPVLEKELRVASRRKRNYVLPFVYVSALAVFILLAWPHSLKYPGDYSAAEMISRMSQAGIQITAGIMWFQFIAMQLIAAMVLSSGIRSEITSKTIGALMTTPIGFFKIVLGKLLGKMLQVTILLAISLPVLSLVRVLGGVKLDFVLAGLCITFTASLFVGALSLRASITSRSAVSAMILSLVLYGIFFYAIPALLLQVGLFQTNTLLSAWQLVTPGVAFRDVTTKMMQPVGGAVSYWPIHCVIMLVLTFLVLLLAARGTRRMALRSLDGRQAGLKKRPGASAGQAGAVSGPAVLWKDMRHFYPSSLLKTVLAVLAFLAIMSILYVPCGASGLLRSTPGQGIFIFLYFGVACLVTLLMSATGITVEKESRALVVLLTTPISDWSIIQDKAFSVARRTAPAWMLLAIHLLVFVVIGYVHPMMVVGIAAISVYMVVLLTGVGLYVSSRLKTSSNAVLLSLAVCVGLWFIVPQIARFLRVDFLETIILANPFYQMGLVVNIGVASSDAHWDWESCSLVCMSFLINSSVGLLLMSRARVQMRRRLFC